MSWESQRPIRDDAVKIVARASPPAAIRQMACRHTDIPSVRCQTDAKGPDSWSRHVGKRLAPLYRSSV
jgi:hypothetical protein